MTFVSLKRHNASYRVDLLPRALPRRYARGSTFYYVIEKSGGHTWARTKDPLIKSQSNSTSYRLLRITMTCHIMLKYIGIKANLSLSLYSTLPCIALRCGC